MNKEFIKQLTDIVESNLVSETFGTEDLAREIGMSHSNLNRKLKSISNQNISQFIREIRLKKAKELLMNEDFTVSEISFRVGFGSPTYFNKCFHEYFGVTPGELRITEPDTEPDNEPEEQLVEPILKKNKRTKILLSLVISLIILIPTAIFLIHNVSCLNAENAEEKSIALLPFKYLSEESEKQYLADGIMDAILVHLSKIKDLRVVSRTSVEQYRKTDKTSKTIGRELDVAYVLEGSFLKEGDKVRLILQLIKTSDDSHAWANEYDRQWKDIFSVQSEVSETIANELQATIAPKEKQLIRKIPTDDLTAYDFYQQGKNEYVKFNRCKSDSNRSALVNAKNLYHKALVYDSTFAQAYVGLARIFWDDFYYKTNYFTNLGDSALILANLAISYDNQLAEAYCIRGNYYSEYGNIEQAFKEYDKAIELNPNDWESYYQKGFYSQWIFGDFTKAIDYFLKASVRNRGKELPDILYRLGCAYLDPGFTDKAKQYFQEAFILSGDSAAYYNNLGFIEFCEENFENALHFQKKASEINSIFVCEFALTYSFLGRYKEANICYEKFLEHIMKYGDAPTYYLNNRIGYSYQKVGKLKESGYYFNQQIKYDLECIQLNRGLAKMKHVYYDQASVYAVLGDKGKAYENLDELNKKQSFALWWVPFFKHDPLFSSIRQEPRFQNILKDVETKYQAEHDRVGKWLAEQGML